MVSLPGKRADRAGASPEPITSRLLAAMLDEKRLATIGTLSILDFGRANRQSFEFFNQFPCRLSVLDAADTLIDWSTAMEARLNEPPSVQQMQLELSGMLSIMDEQRFDLIFLWDTLNHIHEHALPAFAGFLRRHVTTHFRGHGFMLQKRGTEPMLRHMSIAGVNSIMLQDLRRVPLHMHSRRLVNESLGSDLSIDQGVLHSDGRLEFMLTHGGGRGGARVVQR